MLAYYDFYSAIDLLHKDFIALANNLINSWKLTSCSSIAGSKTQNLTDDLTAAAATYNRALPENYICLLRCLPTVGNYWSVPLEFSSTCITAAINSNEFLFNQFNSLRFCFNDPLMQMKPFQIGCE